MLANKESAPYHLTATPYIIILCAVGVFLNRVFATFATNIPIPLYLDTIMTITITLLAGPLWGSVTGTLTNTIALIFNYIGIEFLLFALCNIATALITWGFIRLFPRELNFNFNINNYKKRITLTSSRISTVMDYLIVLSLLSLALCFAMSILGGLIAFFIGLLREEATHPIVTAHIYMFSENTPLVIQEILSRIPINIIDRFISVFAGFGFAIILRIFCKNFSRSSQMHGETQRIF